MDTKYVMMVDIRSRVFSDLETLSRHEKYGDLIKGKTNSQIKLIILSRQTKQSPETSFLSNSFETVIIPRSIVSTVVQCKNLAKRLREYDVDALICGDPWESYLLARLLRRRFFCNSKIQVQLHGDFASPKWGNASLNSRLRKRLIFLKSRHISQIRLTSEEQFRSLSKRYSFENKKVKIIPVPLHLPIKRPIPREQINPIFGLVGRLHTERGLETFSQFAKAFYVYNKKSKFVIIGDGPERRRFQSSLLSSIPETAISFLGELSGEIFHENFASIDVLCSFAATESYGRAAREALALGIPILAQHSAGLDQLALEGAGEFIQFLPSEPTSETYIQMGLASLRITVPESFFESCKRTNEDSINQLISSWIEMVQIE